MSTPLTTSGARRGCGYREPGGAYFAVPLSPAGLPVEAFVIDPPQLLDKDELGVIDRGVALIDRDGTTHVVDIVGREAYDTVYAYLEEVRRLGVSRRAPDNLNFSRLSTSSRLLLAHGHADIENAADFPSIDRCPCAVHGHDETYAGMCARLWPQEPLPGAEHRLAIFASFHIPQIEVVTDPEQGRHEKTAAAAAASQLPVIEVPQ